MTRHPDTDPCLPDAEALAYTARPGGCEECARLTRERDEARRALARNLRRQARWRVADAAKGAGGTR